LGGRRHGFAKGGNPGCTFLGGVPIHPFTVRADENQPTCSVTCPDDIRDVGDKRPVSRLAPPKFSVPQLTVADVECRADQAYAPAEAVHNLAMTADHTY